MKVLRVLRSPRSYAIWKLKSVASSSNVGRVWVEDHSPVLVSMRPRLSAEHPFEGLKLGVCLPGTWESFMFLAALEAGGASLLYYPMFCDARVGLELLKSDSVRLFGRGDAGKVVQKCDFIHDSTAFFGRLVVSQRAATKGIIEQTASGTGVYRDFEAKGLLRQPVLDLDASRVKRVGENRMATGLGLVEALLRLHVFLPSKRILILGFGSVGEGCAMYLKGLGCVVSVYDVDADRVQEAERSGCQVGELDVLLPQADIVVNATGSLSPVLGGKELSTLKRGSILVNMGGIGWDRRFLDGKPNVKAGDWVSKVFLNDSEYFYEVASGLPVNFFFASGTDTETMDVVFSLSVLALEYLVKNYGSLPKTLQPIPEAVQHRHLELVAKYSARRDIVDLGKR